ncbi:MAG: hypothetical protein IJ682_13045, partial [Lachnospiraceae bacterium]|nr:hypothetical protein [Lachnospiraceae bacterium]
HFFVPFFDVLLGHTFLPKTGCSIENRPSAQQLQGFMAFLDTSFLVEPKIDILSGSQYFVFQFTKILPVVFYEYFILAMIY